MRQLRRDFGARRKDEVKKEIRVRAGGKGTRGFALPGGLQAFGNRSGVERLEDNSVAHYFDLFNGNGGAREVGHFQFVHQVDVPVHHGDATVRVSIATFTSALPVATG